MPSLLIAFRVDKFGSDVIMSSIYLVGGEKHGKLRSYMETRGSLSVVGSVDYLARSKSEIQSSIIKADKMIYMYINESVNIREEMNVLRNLLTGDGFFTVKEIVFFILDTPTTQKGVDYIKSLEAQLKQDNIHNLPVFDLKISSSVPSYEDIYSEILGLGDFGSSYSNNRVTVYRVERGSDVKRVSEMADNTNMSVIPYDLGNIKIYNDMKKTTALTEYFNPIVETPKDRDKYDNPRVGTYNVDPYRTSTKTILVTGEKYSGKTTCACAIGASIAGAGHKVLLLDLTGTSDTELCLDKNRCEYDTINLVSYIGSALFGDGKNLCILNGLKSSVGLDVFLYVMSNARKTGYNVIIVECDIDVLNESILTMIKDSLARVIYVTSRFEESISKIQDCERILNADGICLITSSINLAGYKKTLEDKEIKERIRSIAAVASRPLDVSSNSGLYEALFGGKL